VRAGHGPIPATVKQKDRSDDVRGVETPRADGGEIVIDEPPHASGDGGTDDVDEPRPLTGEGGFVFGGEVRLVVCLRQVLLQRGSPCRRRAQLGRATRPESLESVEPLGAERGHPGHADHAQDAFRQQRAACQGVRTAAGMAHDREAVDA